jgi:hypothetical protein
MSSQLQAAQAFGNFAGRVREAVFQRWGMRVPWHALATVVTSRVIASGVMALALGQDRRF